MKRMRLTLEERQHDAILYTTTTRSDIRALCEVIPTGLILEEPAWQKHAQRLVSRISDGSVTPGDCRVMLSRMVYSSASTAVSSRRELGCVWGNEQFSVNWEGDDFRRAFPLPASRLQMTPGERSLDSPGLEGCASTDKTLPPCNVDTGCLRSREGSVLMACRSPPPFMQPGKLSRRSPTAEPCSHGGRLEGLRVV